MQPMIIARTIDECCNSFWTSGSHLLVVTMLPVRSIIRLSEGANRNRVGHVGSGWGWIFGVVATGTEAVAGSRTAQNIDSR